VPESPVVDASVVVSAADVDPDVDAEADVDVEVEVDVDPDVEPVVEDDSPSADDSPAHAPTIIVTQQSAKRARVIRPPAHRSYRDRACEASASTRGAWRVVPSTTLSRGELLASLTRTAEDAT
jgi:hypothetical protein